MPDDEMSFYLGADKPPSMKDFENQEKFLERQKALEKHLKRLVKLQTKQLPAFIKKEDRLYYLFHRDLIEIAMDAIKENVYLERKFIDEFTKTAKILLGNSLN